MEKIIISPDELKEIVKEAIKNALETKDDAQTKLVSREAAAKRLGVDVSTLWRWDKSGYLKVSTHLGRSCWYTERALQALERGEREDTFKI